MHTALIAEDEPLLADILGELLERVWPQLRVLEVVNDGDTALARIDALRPDVVFLDIRMPGKNGLEVAQALADGLAARQADEPAYVPLVVFVTAYDQYAIDAFESAAADYLLKPVSEERLARCADRVRARLAARLDSRPDTVPSLQQLMTALNRQIENTRGGNPARLRFIRASLGDVIRQIPVDDVLYLEAQDKYVAVVTREATALVRTPLSELLASLDPERFVQIHRSTVVRIDAIDTIRRDITGRQFVHLREKAGGREVKLPVSRQFAGQFRGQ